MSPQNRPSRVQQLLDALQDAPSAVVLSIRAALRGFLSRQVFPEVSPDAQRAAGEAAARAGLSQAASDLASLHQVSESQFRDGMENLAGAEAAGGGSRRLNTPDPDIPQEAGVSAFFDVDNTLIKGASILIFARGLAVRRIFTFREILGFAYKQLKFRLVGTENVGEIHSGRDQALALVEGLEESELIDLAEEIWHDKIAERIFPGTKELADMHLQAGQEVWLVTATPVQLAQVIARELGFTGALGTVAEVQDGRFTGRMMGDILHGEGKKHAVVALAAMEGFDLERCTAYSDSMNDAPLLDMVGTAVAVNPDPALRKAAKQRGWEVRDYRRSRQLWYGMRNLGRRAGTRVGHAARRGARSARGYWVTR